MDRRGRLGELGRRGAQRVRRADRGPGGPARREEGVSQRARALVKVTLPGDPLLQDSIDWGKQNLADLTQVANDVDIRWTNQGKEWTPEGSVDSMRWVGAGFPDYPWLFGVDGEYTAHASVTLGQFEPIKDHMRALREISDILSDDSGVVVHEVVADGSVWFGKDSRRTNPDGTISYDFNTDEIVKFPGAVALIWRWTGDDEFRDDMLDFMWRGLEYVRTELDADGDGWPEGNGNVERPGMGPEKLDNTVYYIRGLYDFADMARSAGQTERADAAEEHADELASLFEDAWWKEEDEQYADSLRGMANEKVNQKHWIGVDPMEVELYRDGEFEPGLAVFATAARARDAGELLLQRRAARQPRAVPHGLRRRAERCRRVRHLLARDWRPGRRRRQLRPHRPGAAAALHGGQRRDPVLGAGHWGHARRAAGRDAGDLPLRPGPRRAGGGAGHAAQHRPLLDLPVDVHAGLGPLRHGLVGRPPTAGGAAAPRARPARGRSAGAGRPDQRPGRGHPPGGGCGRRARRPRGQPLHDDHRHERRAGRRRSGSATRCRAASTVASVRARRRAPVTRLRVAARPTAASRCASPADPDRAPHARRRRRRP